MPAEASRLPPTTPTLSGPPHGPYPVAACDRERGRRQWFFQGAMGGVLGVAAFGGAVRALGAARASALPSFTPAVTTLFSIPVLARLLTRLELLGMALATAGLLLAILGPGPRAVPRRG